MPRLLMHAWIATNFLLGTWGGLISVVSWADEPQREFSAADLEFFEKDVRPILVNRCYECHSGTLKAPKGGLRLDSRAAVLAGGDTGPAVQIGDAKGSLLIDAINYGDTYQMPPKSRLPTTEIATLTKWVERGLPWPTETPRPDATSDAFDLAARKAAHWCWQPVVNHELPPLRNTGWSQQNLDRFILAKLEETGLDPARPAERHTLLRRLYFDLIGLPPTPEQTAAFLADESPRAYEALVDQVLRNPRFGERWARHWMDVVRYAETCGHEFDYPIHHAWRYRDYLIRAFNADLPYDQFVQEQIAGDLFPNPRMHPEEHFNESIIGTGFWFLHEALHAPVDSKSDLAIRVDNQIDVFSKAFLGVTVACARCHDHKFDAISTKDYYALAGFLRSTRRQEALLDAGGKIQTLANQVQAIRSEFHQSLQEWSLENRIPSAGEFRQILRAVQEVLGGQSQPGDPVAAAGHRRSISAVANQFKFPADGLQSWVRAFEALSGPMDEHPLQIWAKAASHSKPITAGSAWNSWRTGWQKRTDRHATERDDYKLFASFDEGTFADWVATGEAFGRAPVKTAQWEFRAGQARLTETTAAHSGYLSPKFQGVLRSPNFTINTQNIYYRVAGENCEIRLIVDGYTMIEFHQLLFGGCKFPVNTDGKWVWHRQSGDLGMYQGHRAYIEVVDHGDGWAALDQVCFSNRDSPPAQPSSLFAAAMAAEPAMDSLETLGDRLGEGWGSAISRWRSGNADVFDIQLLNWALSNGCFSYPIVETTSGNSTGASPEDRGKASELRVAELLQQLPSPLRVTAALEGPGENEQVFIRGNPHVLGEEAPRQLLTALVGPQPPPPEGSGRLQLAHQVTDPANPLTSRVLVNRVWHHLFGAGLVPTTDNFGVLGERPTHPELLDYLAHQVVLEGWSMKRLIRSIVLSSTYQMSSIPRQGADELDPTNRLWHRRNVRRLEGEAIRDAMLLVSGRLDAKMFGPSVAVHITPFMQGRGKPGSSGPIDGDGRRSVYQEVRRNFLSPMMLAFDTPIPFNTVGRRNKSNVPAQALILMNDPFVRDQARNWAERVAATKDSTWEEQVHRTYLTAFARPAGSAEVLAAREFFTTQARELQISPEEALRNRSVWSDFCHVLFNVKEFSFVD